MFCLKIRRELIPFKDAPKLFHSLAHWLKKSLLSVIPFSERKTEIVFSSSVVTMDVRVSQNIKIVIYKPVDVLKSGNVSMCKALLK